MIGFVQKVLPLWPRLLKLFRNVSGASCIPWYQYVFVCCCTAETTSVHRMLTLVTTSSSWQASPNQRFVISAENFSGNPV